MRAWLALCTYLVGRFCWLAHGDRGSRTPLRLGIHDMDLGDPGMASPMGIALCSPRCPFRKQCCGPKACLERRGKTGFLDPRHSRPNRLSLYSKEYVGWLALGQFLSLGCMEGGRRSVPLNPGTPDCTSSPLNPIIPLVRLIDLEPDELGEEPSHSTRLLFSLICECWCSHPTCPKLCCPVFETRRQVRSRTFFSPT